jgi:PTH1 family peptidyl-tRNA hydrolase
LAGRLVVGLCNPGDDYAHTRHNLGAMVTDLLAKKWGVTFQRSGLLAARVATASPEGLPAVRLVQPTSYMNLSGPVYARALKVFETPAEDALVVVDDFMLDFGRMRLRPDGSSGGHNGLKSVEEALGSRAYPRLRIGIGPVPGRQDPADYVLGRFGAEQRKELPFVVEEGASAVLTWLREGMTKAMDRHNRKGPGDGE